MGNSYDYYTQKIITESNKSITQSEVESIVMQSNFQPKEIYFLLIEFKKLNPNFENKISNSQLLSLPNFKYSPFRKSLIRALGLKEDISTFQDENPLSKRRLKYVTDENEVMIMSKEDMFQNRLFDINDKVLTKNEKERKDKLLLIQNYHIKEEEKIRNRGKVNDNDFINNHSNEIGIIGRQLIGFSHFCKIMQVFGENCRVDVKIKCKYIDISF